MFIPYLYYLFLSYFYLIIFVIIFEIVHYFIKFKLKIESNIVKLFISIAIFVSILFIVPYMFLLFFYGIIFFLCLKLVFNIKELCILLLIIFPITFLAPFFCYNNYHLEYFYKEKGMKIYTEAPVISNALSPTKRNIFCSNHTPLNCKFIRSLDIGFVGGWCSFGEDCSGGFMIECVYMCPK